MFRDHCFLLGDQLLVFSKEAVMIPEEFLMLTL